MTNPAPDRWVFSGEMLANQLSDLGTDRVIIAVHDLNTGTATQRPEARRELEQKLGAISRADDAIAADDQMKRDRALFHRLMVDRKFTRQLAPEIEQGAQVRQVYKIA